MTDHRSARLNEQFKREISQILGRKVRDPRVEDVLVTGVRVTPDLWLARVYFRIMGDHRNQEEVEAGLEAAGPFIRRELGKDLRIRRMPELRFLHDTTLDSAQRIEEVLREVLPDSADEAEESGGPSEGVELEGEQGRGEGDG